MLQEPDSCSPRITYLARKLKLPVSTIQTKLKKFEKQGYIKQYSAELDGDKLGRPLVAFKFAGKKFSKETDLDEFGKKLAKIPQVQEVHFLAGEWDYIIKMRLKDNEEYTKISPKIAVLMDGCKGMISPKVFKDTKKIVIQ